MPRVLIAPVALADVQAPFVDALKNAGLELFYHGHPAQMNEEQLNKALDGVDAALAGSEPYNARVLAAHPQLKVIARVGVGYDTVDVDAATKNGIAVCYAPGTNQGSVAEHTFAMMLAWTRSLVNQHNSVKAGGWPRGTLLPLRGNTLGIAGLGRIGKAVATRAQAFDMKVIAHDAVPDTAWAVKNNVPLVSWEELLRRSDFLSIHVPALPQTIRMINAQTLAMMKPNAVLVNTARGAVVDEKALYEALKKKQIAGALLDVFDEEPPGKHPLFELDNVIVTPHAAGVDLRSRDDMALSAAESIASLYKGEWPAEKIVNPQVREKFKWR
jgi:D-3-phosphoglycerate dehydrogenase